jgi:hypothetical protein
VNVSFSLYVGAGAFACAVVRRRRWTGEGAGLGGDLGDGCGDCSGSSKWQTVGRDWKLFGRDDGGQRRGDGDAVRAVCRCVVLARRFSEVSIQGLMEEEVVRDEVLEVSRQSALAGWRAGQAWNAETNLR